MSTMSTTINLTASSISYKSIFHHSSNKGKKRRRMSHSQFVVTLFTIQLNFRTLFFSIFFGTVILNRLETVSVSMEIDSSLGRTRKFFRNMSSRPNAITLILTPNRMRYQKHSGEGDAKCSLRQVRRWYTSNQRDRCRFRHDAFCARWEHFHPNTGVHTQIK